VVSLAPDSREIKLYGHLLTHLEAPVTVSHLSSVCETETAQTTLLFRLRSVQLRMDSHHLDTLREWWRTFNDGSPGLRDEFVATITCGHSETLPDNDLAILMAGIFDASQRRRFSTLTLTIQASLTFYSAVTLYVALTQSVNVLFFVSLNWVLLLSTLSCIGSLLSYLWPNFSIIDNDGSLVSVLTESVSAIESRKLARLSSGRLALIPRQSLAGDVVALCRGGHVPLLLRQHSIGRRFEIVGECYIHEAMNGLLFHSNECEVISLV
jgi:hypothetical protein